MPSSQAFPIQVSLPANSGSSAVSATPKSSDTTNKGVFGGVLSDEIDSVNGQTVTAEAVSEADAVGETANLSLPVDGNGLPLAVNAQLQADIAELVIDTDEELLDGESSAIFGVSIPSLEAQLKTSTLTAKDSGLAHQVTIPIPTDSIRFIAGPQTYAAKNDVANQSISLLPFAEAGIDAETQAATQFKESLQLQKAFSPLIRQADAGIEAGQIGRVLEQFTALSPKPTATPTVSTTLSTTPLSQTGSVTTPQLSIDVPIQDQRWQKAFSQRVVWSVGNVQSAQLRLNPAELGRIDIQVNVDNDKANVVFTAQHGVVKDSIEQALPKLREMLAEQGVELENVEIFQDNLNQQQAGNDNDGAQQRGLDGQRLSIDENDENNTEADIFVGDIMFKEDVVDFYV